MSKILLMADHIQTAVLGARLNKGALLNGDEIVALSPRQSAVRIGQKLGLTIELVKSTSPLPHDMIDCYHDNTFEVNTGYTTVEDARELHDALVLTALEKIKQSTESWKCILAWNGAHVSSRAAETIKANCGMPILYMEIANLPGRMVFDSRGSNSDASVAVNPEILDRYPITDEVFECWKEQYIQSKLKQVTIPQVKTFVKPNLGFFEDYWGRLLGAAPAFSVNPWHRVWNIYQKKIWEKKLQRCIHPQLPESTFIFLPLQVSTDTNLAVRSAMNNFDAIDYAINEARSIGAKVVAKIHPAEREGMFFKQLYEKFSVEKEELMLTNEITAKCILASECVITINSTVGFEAMMLGKKAVVLQPALYSKWNTRQMAQFALEYTIPFDMYAESNATKEQWLNIISRAE